MRSLARMVRCETSNCPGDPLWRGAAGLRQFERDARAQPGGAYAGAGTGTGSFPYSA